MKKENTPYYIVQSVDRAFSIFELFIRERRPLGITDVADELKLHKSVVHRLLATAEEHQLLEQIPETGKYQVGPKCFELGSVYANNSLITEGKRFLPELAEKVGEKAHLGILHEGTVLYLLNQESPKSTRINAPVGVRNPVSSTALGKVLMAWIDETQAMDILRKQGLAIHTPKSISTIEAYMEELKQVRARGYAIDDEELSTGFRCVAFPIRDQTSKVIAAISVGGRSFGTGSLEPIAEVVRNYAVLISERLGYVPKGIFE
ncbi:IclR family transcriptional regulator [Paenibacillus mesophilus]|uniref:IclR family transcriptional regulator n=1 Tax=Paenibacillus mesophilus TaxID=2582849 RepID=UPI00110D5AA5|nr:IclR family transcriptional regulator [Paenibacillus mesophilus]TMV48598.1 IclR family transcriptional regulator [Paenibacillus mesophilus]